jgi:hypothetical protein
MQDFEWLDSEDLQKIFMEPTLLSHCSGNVLLYKIEVFVLQYGEVLNNVCIKSIHKK